jgi:type VI secretion system secreted protein VgrG
MGADRQEWRLTGSYLVRTYCVQYRESRLAFIQRLLEEEGIFYWFDMSADGATIVLSDDSTAADDLADNHHLPFRPAGGDAAEDHVRAIEEQHRMRSGKFTLRDYDFERPDLDQTADASADVDTDLEQYDYPGGYVDPGEGKRRAQVRLEAEQTERRMLRVEGDCIRLSPGKKVVVEDATHDEANGEWVVVAVTHEQERLVTGEQVTSEQAREGEGRASVYLMRALLLPADVKYRLEAVTRRPLIDGPQTAIVVAPEGAQAEEIHTDKWGRCKVKFHWDLAPPMDDKASCWMRTKQMQTSGSMVLPRVSWEVVVEFLEGDPDKPFVTGRVYNGVFMPPYALPEGKSRTSIKSHSTPGGEGYNEVRFEDKAGGEEVYIHAAKDMVIKAANNKSQSVGNQEAKVVTVNSTTSVASNQTLQVTKGNKATIGADQSVSVGANRKVEVNALQALNVAGSSATTIGGKHFEMDGDPLTALVNLAVEKVTEIAQAQAAEALAQVDAYAQSKIDQVMGPINDMQAQVGQVADAMDAVSQGQLGEVSTALREASALPQVDQLGGAMRDAAFGGVQSAGGAMGVEVGAPAEGATGVSAQTGLDQLVNGAIERGVRSGGDAVDSALHSAFGDALGLDAAGGGGASAPPLSGPELDQANISEEDRAKGPGHSLTKVDANLDETVATAKIMAAITGINTEVAGNMTQTVGIGRIEGVFGDRTEAVDGAKTEKALGLIVLSKGDVSEKVSGSKTCMVGGAIVDLIDGGHTIEASGPATFIAALHKIEAKTKITFKVGGSEVVIEGGGVTMKAPIISIMAPKIQLTKKVAQN